MRQNRRAVLRATHPGRRTGSSTALVPVRRGGCAGRIVRLLLRIVWLLRRIARLRRVVRLLRSIAWLPGITRSALSILSRAALEHAVRDRQLASGRELVAVLPEAFVE